MLAPSEVAELNQQLQQQDPLQVLTTMSEAVPRLAIAFSGAEDVLLVHFASKLSNPPAFFCIDTGRLHPQTLRFVEQVRTHYKLDLDIIHPDREKLDKLIKNKGLYSFYEDGHEECCHIRKVEPLGRYLRNMDAWATGQRQDQSPTRKEIPTVEVDSSFSSESHQVLKLNPLANWSSSQVWDHIRMLEIPYNPLHDRGFVSIGCEPCTRAIGPGQHEREGRWWWEEATIKECGLHRGNLDPVEAKEPD